MTNILHLWLHLMMNSWEEIRTPSQINVTVVHNIPRICPQMSGSDATSAKPLMNTSLPIPVRVGELSQLCLFFISSWCRLWALGRCLLLRIFREFRSCGIFQVVVEKQRFLFYNVNIFWVLVENMFSDKFWAFEFFATERTKPLIFCYFLTVAGNKFFNFICLSF